jgi:hypothetical protein
MNKGRIKIFRTGRIKIVAGSSMAFFKLSLYCRADRYGQECDRGQMIDSSI